MRPSSEGVKYSCCGVAKRLRTQDMLSHKLYLHERNKKQRLCVLSDGSSDGGCSCSALQQHTISSLDIPQPTPSQSFVVGILSTLRPITTATQN
ncbi:hypothetical protein E2C01_062635 [Portunus trituberculatus]|uniref:Uncharacterized protein n=1 Tax=Portunus trituberculatus TaxID=210409 RepID=A0A5B7HE77_PORTR|nr:hypothetical protein [Portunus trituberculatus]